MKLFVCLLFIICNLVIAAEAAPISSTELIENADLYSGKIVEFEGEAIGNVMVRGDHAWINVKDGVYAIGIWAKKEQALKIKQTGGYRHIGDKVLVTGTFYRADPQQGGDLDIRANQITIIQKGYKRKLTIKRSKFIIAAILFLACFIVIVYPYLIPKRKKKIT
ncbi:MAG: DNA-binding protein [Candidatus Saganbacteria bacterium]|nr:DNA-binding protein [Candidatus Saganbacteria bacterium]